MKTRLISLFLAGSLLLAGTAVASAQPGWQRGPGGQRPDPAQMAQRRADMMKETVNLTDEQYAKVVEVYKAQSEQFAKAREEGVRPDREQMQKMREETNAKLKEILTPDQFEAWEKSDASRGPRGPRGPRGGGGGIGSPDGED